MWSLLLNIYVVPASRGGKTLRVLLSRDFANIENVASPEQALHGIFSCSYNSNIFNSIIYLIFCGVVIYLTFIRGVVFK